MLETSQELAEISSFCCVNVNHLAPMAWSCYGAVPAFSLKDHPAAYKSPLVHVISLGPYLDPVAEI